LTPKAQTSKIHGKKKATIQLGRKRKGMREVNGWGNREKNLKAIFRGLLEAESSVREKSYGRQNLQKNEPDIQLRGKGGGKG